MRISPSPPRRPALCSGHVLRRASAGCAHQVGAVESRKQRLAAARDLRYATSLPVAFAHSWSTVSSLKLLQAFLSYASDNYAPENELDERRLAGLSQLLQDEMCAQTGLDVQIFQDTANLTRGDRWEEKIRDAAAGALFLIPVVTPRYFLSESCRAVYCAFSNARAGQTGILPIYYIEAHELEHSAWRSEHEWAEGIADCLWVDFRELRSKALASIEVQYILTAMATRFKQRLEALGVLGTPRPTGAAELALIRRSLDPVSPASPPNTPVFEPLSRASAESFRVAFAPPTPAVLGVDDRSLVPASTQFKRLPGALVVIAALALASVAFRRPSELAPSTVVKALVPYETKSFPFPPGLRPIGFSRSGEWLVAERGDGKLALFEVGRPDRAPRTVEWELTAAMAMAPTRSLIAAARGARLILYDSRSGTQLELPHDSIRGPVSRLEFNPDGSVLAIAGRDGGVALVSIPEPIEPLQPMPLEDLSEVDALAFDFNGQRLAVASKQLARVSIYDIHAADIQVTTLRSHSDPFLPHSVAFSPDGLRLASGDALSGKVQIWELATSSVLQEYRAAEGSVESLSFDLQGNRLVSVGEEGTLRVWNTLTQTSDIWLPVAATDGFAAAFLGNTLYTSAAITNEPGLLVWVHDRLGAEPGVECRLIGSTSIQEVSDRHGACLFSRISPGKYTISAGVAGNRGVEVHSPLVLSISSSGG
jgi:WD domain, G-beta repeat